MTQPVRASNRPAPAQVPVPDGPDDISRGARTVMVTTVAVIIIVILNLVVPPHIGDVPVYLLLRRLYYVPVVYAASMFGKRGGLFAAILCAITLAVQAELDRSMGPSEAFVIWLEIGSFSATGLLFGWVRDTEVYKAHDLQQVSAQLEEAYRKLEERAIQLINVQDYTSSILRSITSGVLTVGPDGSIATANPAAEHMFGMSEYEMVPKPIGSLFRDDGGLSADVARVLSGRVPFSTRETTVRTCTGREVHVQASTSRMRAVGGGVLGAVVAVEDVSDVHALTDQLIRADRLAAMGELTAGVAHEIRNPLGVIRASVQLLEETKSDVARTAEVTDVIKQEIDRVDRVIKALLDFGRPKTPTMVRIDMNDILNDVVLFTNRFAAQAHVRLDLVRGGSALPVMADPDQLKQVFLNLVTNAVQAMGDDGGTITITATEDGNYVAVSVRDTGPGIPAEDLPRVFDPFFTKRAGGTGLGLTIVHRIIDEHGGHLEVRSSESGTTFTVSVPTVIED